MRGGKTRKEPYKQKTRSLLDLLQTKWVSLIWSRSKQIKRKGLKMRFTGSSSSSLIILNAIKLMLGLVFFCWLLIWVLRPTDIFKRNWQPKLRLLTNSTYFGRQGTNMLLYTFPILFISVVGCFYLHMMKKRSNNSQSSLRSRLEAWKKPVIVKGPLGILTAMELAFCLMFLAMLAWVLSMYITNGFTRITKESAEKDGHTIWQAKLETVGLRFGHVGNTCLAFLFFPVTRGSSLLPLIGLTSESSIKYHIWLGHFVMALLSAHGFCYTVLWISTNRISLMLQWATDGVAILAGEIALVSGVIMWVTTFPRIRRKMFELFYYTHQLYILFLTFYLLHVGMSFFCLILPGIYLFMVDRFLRFWQSQRKVRLVSARLLPSETVELNFSKISGFSYSPTSTVFINVPSISSLQWHPFTVSSSSSLEPETLSVIIKKEGRWTQKLYQNLNEPSIKRLVVSVEGPYGPASVNFLRHDSLVMVSGGSGITPFISIIRELIVLNMTPGASTPRVLLICAFKTSADLTMLDLLFPVSSDISKVSKLQLRIEAFVTREKAPASSGQNAIRTICFKPDPSDLPVAPILGPNSWLWLGAIITSSFIAFLALIGMLTRYYIYPIESMGAAYSLTSRALMNLLCLCACIAATCSIVVLWNKKQSRIKGNQLQFLDEMSSWSDNGDRELESFSRGSVAQATSVHYGRRPDLKKLIRQADGLSVGVMVSGPFGMRRDVAAVCSCAHADNLHFESLSFCW